MSAHSLARQPSVANEESINDVLFTFQLLDCLTMVTKVLVP